jgi:hypothetical protein
MNTFYTGRCQSGAALFENVPGHAYRSISDVSGTSNSGLALASNCRNTMSQFPHFGSDRPRASTFRDVIALPTIAAFKSSEFGHLDDLHFCACYLICRILTLPFLFTTT